VLLADLRPLFTVQQDSVFVGQYRVGPAVFLQAKPNLLLLPKGGSVGVVLVWLKEPNVFK
jgi:hypothetical protein